MTETIDDMSKRLLAECEHMQNEIRQVDKLKDKIAILEDRLERYEKSEDKAHELRRDAIKQMENNRLAAMEAIRLMQVEIYRLRELLQTISSTCDCWSAAEIRDKIRKELDRGEGKNVAE
jgi:hypothetical protein